MGIQTMGSHGKEGSIYSLTLSEVESHLGEPLHSMNLDEFLKNVVHSEVGHHYRRTGSFMKTVDDVWHDIQQNNAAQESCNTLREMTLEDFLVKAGLVDTSSRESCNPVSSGSSRHFPRGINWLNQNNIAGTYVPCHPQSSSSGGGYNEVQITGMFSDTQTPGRKRIASEEFEEKTVERRQKRMIKNRESAARSRARKQAYTNELENKVSRLEEENEQLRKQKQLDNMMNCVPPPEPKYRLRRTSSSPF